MTLFHWYILSQFSRGYYEGCTPKHYQLQIKSERATNFKILHTLNAINADVNCPTVNPSPRGAATHVTTMLVGICIKELTVSLTL